MTFDSAKFGWVKCNPPHAVFVCHDCDCVRDTEVLAGTKRLRCAWCKLECGVATWLIDPLPLHAQSSGDGEDDAAFVERMAGRLYQECGITAGNRDRLIALGRHGASAASQPASDPLRPQRQAADPRPRDASGVLIPEFCPHCGISEYDKNCGWPGDGCHENGTAELAEASNKPQTVDTDVLRKLCKAAPVIMLESGSFGFRPGVRDLYYSARNTLPVLLDELDRLRAAEAAGKTPAPEPEWRVSDEKLRINEECWKEDEAWHKENVQAALELDLRDARALLRARPAQTSDAIAAVERYREEKRMRRNAATNAFCFNHAESRREVADEILTLLGSLPLSDVRAKTIEECALIADGEAVAALSSNEHSGYGSSKRIAQRIRALAPRAEGGR